MSKRLNSQLEARVWSRIARIRRDLNQMGSYQLLGSSSFIPGRISSSDDYDITVNVPALGSGYATILITFTQSSTQFDYMSLVYRMIVVPAEFPGYTIVWERLPPTKTQQRWKLYLKSYYNAVPGVKLKFYFFALGSGTFSVAQV